MLKERKEPKLLRMKCRNWSIHSAFKNLQLFSIDFCFQLVTAEINSDKSNVVVFTHFYTQFFFF